ncbi:DUF1439 domain-containing protein [Verrucomicrobiaceae bacterium R5-34]|nr:DUF1439 domain-containing protein [Verrucomicrobiaceae bacterium R5-34]
MKRALIIAGMLTLIAVIGGYAYFKGKRYQIAITQQQIDRTLAKQFPVKKSALLIFQLTYSNPQVTLLAENHRIQVGLDASLNVKINDEAKNLGGGVTVTSSLRYDQNTQAFYLTDTTFDRFEIDGVPEKYRKTVLKLAAEYAAEQLEQYPVYTLKATDAKKTAAKLLLKNVEIDQQTVVVTLGL